MSDLFILKLGIIFFLLTPFINIKIFKQTDYIECLFLNIFIVLGTLCFTFFTYFMLFYW